jgi:hypothetical protein
VKPANIEYKKQELKEAAPNILLFVNVREIEKTMSKGIINFIKIYF